MPRKQSMRNNHDMALSRRKQIKPYLGNKKTKDKWRQRNKNEKLADVRWIAKLSQWWTTPDEKISLILNSISASSEFYDDVQNVIEDLTTAMKFNWYSLPFDGRVLPFGSSVTKLALKESDIDVFIDFMGKIPENAQEMLINMIKTYKMFKRVIGIKARVPIVQCKHIGHYQTTFCDISYTNIIGVYVSHLIQAILQLDSRLKPFIMILKYLVKKSHLIPNKQISSFKVIILCIYYCQQLKEPILPPIRVLERLATSRETINGWNVPLSWPDMTSSLPPVTNRMTVPELLTGFFKFYSEFDFGFWVVSPYMGKTYAKSVFSRIDLLPEEYTCYREKLKENPDFRLKADCAFCVQDPVDHGNNIMRNASLNARLNFQRFCRENYKILSDVNGDLGVAFTYFGNEIFTSENGKNVIHVGTFSDLDALNIFTEEGLRSYWYEQVCDKLMSILRRVYRFEVRSEETGTEGGSDKYIVGKTGHFGLFGCLRAKAQNQFDFPQKMDPITRQELITNYLMDTELRGIEELSLSIIIKCYFMREPTRVKFQLFFSKIEDYVSDRSCKVLKAFENIMPLLQSIV